MAIPATAKVVTTGTAIPANGARFDALADTFSLLDQP